MYKLENKDDLDPLMERVGSVESWNVRDIHMMDALDRLMAFHGSGAKSIVWAHNPHVGDARATDMKRAGMVNLGQLAREHAAKSDSVVLAGFGTYRGSVIAAKAWGEEMEIMPIPAAIEGSWDIFFSQHWRSQQAGHVCPRK